MTNEFYVYEWFRKDNGDIFHVGMGKGNRKDNITNRNNYFKRIINKYECDVRIYKSNLSQQEAWDIEKGRIKELKSVGQAYTNFHVGGSGGDTFTHKPDELKEKQIQQWRESMIRNGGCSGERNSFYGRKHSEDTKRIIGEKAKERCKNGLNPMLGRNHTEESKMKMSINKKGKNTGYDNPNSKKVKVIIPKDNFEKEFGSIRLARKYVAENYGVSQGFVERNCFKDNYKPNKGAITRNKNTIRLEGFKFIKFND